MAVAKLTCPNAKCRVTLKPSRPVPEGKTVTCPKCGTRFVAGDGAVDDDDRVQNAAKSPARSSAKAAAPPRKPVDDDEDDGPEVYGVVQEQEPEAARKPVKKKRRVDEDDDEDEDDEDEEEEEEGFEKQYLEDLKIRDPRGPAQEAIVGPSNKLMLVSFACIVIQLVSIGWWGWPFIFAEHLCDLRKLKNDDGKFIFVDNKGVDLNRDWKDLTEREKQIVQDADEESMWERLFWLIFPVPGMIYGALIGYGAVKMQNLESYRWSMTAAIMTLAPVSYAGFGLTGLWWLHALIEYLLDDWGSYGSLLSWMPIVLVCAWWLLVGLVALTGLMREDVKVGFTWTPE
jgi:hypothetical protein